MNAPLTDAAIALLRREVDHRMNRLLDPTGPVANALETSSLLDEVEASRAKLAAIQSACRGWEAEGEEYDDFDSGTHVVAHAVLDILNGDA